MNLYQETTSYTYLYRAIFSHKKQNVAQILESISERIGNAPKKEENVCYTFLDKDQYMNILLLLLMFCNCYETYLF